MLNKVLVYTPQQLSTSQRDTACSNIGALRNHGNASVEELNALTDKLVGSLYTLTDGGQLNSFGSSVPVSAGDMVMLTEEGWRRISSGSGSGGLADIYHDDTMSGDGKSEETKLSVNEMEGPVVMSYDPAVLGGVEYEGHKVGEQLWTCALSYEVGSASWYNDDKATYEKYGMYYKFSDVPLIQAQLSDGWRVPTDKDFKKLVQFVGGSNGKKLISAEDGGTDDYGLGWRLGGYNSEWAGQRGRYRSSDSGNTGMIISGLDVYYNDNNSGTTPTNIVLVKDIVADRDGKKGLVPKPFISDAKRVLNGSGQWVDLPSKISQLENDAGYEKLVISNTPPAPGTPMDVITAVLGNPGGGGEGGAWEEIWKNEGTTNPTTITLDKKFSDYDFILICGKNLSASPGKSFHQTCLIPSSKITSSSVIGVYDDASYVWYNTDGVNTLTFNLSRLLIFDCIYGISLRGGEKKVVDQWNLFKGVLTDLDISVNHKIEVECEMNSSSMYSGCNLFGENVNGQTNAKWGVTCYQGKLYVVYNDEKRDVVFTDVPSSGFHKLVFNDENNQITLDGVVLYTGVASIPSGNFKYTIAGRGSDATWYQNKFPFKSFKITDKSTSQSVLDIECFEKDGFRYLRDKYHHFNAIVR